MKIQTHMNFLYRFFELFKKVEHKILLPFRTNQRLKTHLVYGGATVVIVVTVLFYYQPLPQKSSTQAAPSASPFAEDFVDTDDINVGSTTATIDVINRRAQLAVSDLKVNSSQQTLDNPDILWTGTEYAAVWANNASGSERVYFQRFDPDGNLKEAATQQNPHTGNLRRPAIAYAASISRYGVVYQTDNGGDLEIYFMLLDSTGSKLGSALQITTNTDPSQAPAIVWNATSSVFAVAYDDGPSGNNDIYFQRVSVAGDVPALSGANVRVNTSALNKTRGESAITWDNVNNRYAVAWQDDRTVVGDMEIYMHLLDSSGSLIGVTDSRISIAVSDSRNPDVIWDGSNYVIMWEDQRDGNQEIYYEVADSNLNFQLFANAVRLTNDASVSKEARLIGPSGSGTNTGIVWEDERDGNREVYFVRLDSSYNKLGSDVRVTNASGNSNTPAISFNGSYYTIIHNDFRDNVAGANGNIYLTQVSTAAAKRTLYSPSNLVISNAVDTSSTTIYRARLSATSSFGSSGLITYYLSNNGGTTFEPVQAGNWHVFGTSGSDLRWQAILFTSNISATPQLTQVQITYVGTSNIPVQVTLSAPVNGSTGQSLTPTLQFSSTDADSDFLKYVVQISASSDFTNKWVTYDQRVSQTGFFGQNADSSTAYASGSIASFTIPTSVLSTRSTFYWRVWAVDYNGTGQLSTDISTNNAFSFTVVDDGKSYTEGFLNPDVLGGLSAQTSIVPGKLTIPPANTNVLETITANNVTPTDIVWNGSNYVYTWTDSSSGTGHVYIRSVNASGVAGTKVNVSSSVAGGSTPVLGVNGSTTAVAFSQPDTLWFQLFNGSLSALTSLQKINTSSGTIVPDVAFNGSEWGVVWRRTTDLKFSRVHGASGYKLGSELQIGSASNAPDISWSGSEWGIVYESGADIWFARVDVNGNKIGSSINLTNTGSVTETAPKILWNGEHYLVLWSTSTFFTGVTLSTTGQILRTVSQNIFGSNPFVIWEQDKQRYVIAYSTGSSRVYFVYLTRDLLYDSTQNEIVPNSPITVGSVLPVLAATNGSPQKIGLVWLGGQTSPLNTDRFVNFKQFGSDFIDDRFINTLAGVYYVNTGVLDSTSQNIRIATLTSTATVPTNTSIVYQLSNDGGVNFNTVASGTQFTFPNTGSDLVWQATLSTSDGTVTPQVDAITVTYGSLSTLQVNPPAFELSKGGTQTLTATATYSDSSSADVTLQTTWSSSDQQFASVSSTGVVSGNDCGSATITAVYLGVSANSTLNVKGCGGAIIVDPGGGTGGDGGATPSLATLTKIQVVLGQDSNPSDVMIPFEAQAIYSDGSRQDVTSQAVWSSSDEQVATVLLGMATAQSPGRTTISASYSGFDAGYILNVVPGVFAEITSIEVTPASLSLVQGESGGFTAVAYYSDGSFKDVTTESLWTVSNKAIADVESGMVQAVDVGSTTVTASYQGYFDRGRVYVRQDDSDMDDEDEYEDDSDDDDESEDAGDDEDEGDGRSSDSGDDDSSGSPDTGPQNPGGSSGSDTTVPSGGGTVPAPSVQPPQPTSSDTGQISGKKIARAIGAGSDVNSVSPPLLVTYYLDNLGRIVLVFDKLLAPVSVEDIAHYSVIDTDATVPEIHDTVSVKSVYYNQTYTLFISISGMTVQSGEQYRLNLSDVRSIDGILLTPNPFSVTLSQPEIEEVSEQTVQIQSNPSIQQNTPSSGGVADVVSVKPVALPCQNQWSWEEQYQFTLAVGKGHRDSDEDGLSDLIECQIQTNPSSNDTDGDTFYDGEEVNDYSSDPLDPLDPPQTAVLKLAITNWKDGDRSADPTVLVQGVGREGARVSVYARNNQEDERLLCISEPVLQDKFLCVSEVSLLDGEYLLIVRDQDKTGDVLDEDSVRIVVNSKLGIKRPHITRLSDEDVTAETFLKGLRLVVRDNRPYLIGRTEFGNKAFVTWKSVLYTSSLLVDAQGGEFVSVAPQELEVGEHAVWVYAVRPEDQARSEDINLRFSVSPVSQENPAGRYSYTLLVGLGVEICVALWYFKIALCRVRTFGKERERLL